MVCKICKFCDDRKCRKNAPKIVLGQLGCAHFTDHKAIWPEVRPDIDWCGDFEEDTRRH